MKKVLVSFFVILSTISASFATLRYIPMEEAVRENDLIIIGTLKDISESSFGMETKGTGKILIDQYIAGNVKKSDGSQLKSGDELRLDYVEDFACVYGSHKRIENQQGVFPLKIKPDGEIESKDFRYEIFNNDASGLLRVNNDGGQAGTRTYLYLLPKQKFAIALMTNLQNAWCEELVPKIIEALNEK